MQKNQPKLLELTSKLTTLQYTKNKKAQPCFFVETQQLNLFHLLGGIGGRGPGAADVGALGVKAAGATDCADSAALPSKGST